MTTGVGQFFQCADMKGNFARSSSGDGKEMRDVCDAVASVVGRKLPGMMTVVRGYFLVMGLPISSENCMLDDRWIWVSGRVTLRVGGESICDVSLHL